MPSVLLTDAAVRAYKVEGAARVVVFDAKAKGLVLRVSATSKVWSFVYRAKGSTQQRRLTIGDYPSWSVAQAREKVFALRRAVHDGGDPVAAAKERQGSLTVAGLVDRYITKHAKVKLRSWKDYEGLLRRDLVPALGKRRADEVSRSEIANLLDKIAERAPVVSNRVGAVVGAMFSWAVSEGLVAANPIAGLKRRTQEVAKERVLSDAEIGAFWRASETSAPAYRDTFRLILLTGQRPGECAGIRYEEVDLAKGVWTIPPARVKNKSRHTLPLVGEALNIVSRLCEAHGAAAGPLIVTPRGKELTPQNLAKAFERLRDDAKFDAPVTPHDLRRTAATLMARLEFDRMSIASVLNHATVTKAGVTGSVYDRHDYLPQKKRALEALDAAIIRIVRGS